MYRKFFNFVKFGHVVFELCKQTDRQTDVQSFTPLQRSKWRLSNSTRSC